MSKIKYRFDTKSLTYQRANLSTKDLLLKLFSYLATGLVFSTVVILFAYKFLDSPKEKKLERDNKQLLLQYELLNKRIALISSVLEDIQHRDDNVYRVIFEAEPISDNIRKAGFGGVNRYVDLEGYTNADLIIEASKKLDKISKQLYIQSKSFDDVFKMAKNKTEMLASIPAIQPISNKDLRRLASGFGYRTHPIYKIQHLHTGLDFSAPTGTEIYATGNGVIVSADSESRGYGNNVVIDHGYGYQTLYAHMSTFAVKPRQKVKRGDVIGYVGSTGTSTAPHVHYEVIKNGQKINPINFFFNDLTPEEFHHIIEISTQSNQSFD
ncbi:MAG: M23 family metallopeptidase [Bacteroidetes bacterium]|nr:M23 family metallopeptidase [Bacteroidota bacterium]HET6245606.1 M23 family metallopeptidase [Bacteroidia bacterium]